MATIDDGRGTDIDAIVATMVERIADRFDPERILLFGSRARGDARDWSDVDLLVVMPGRYRPARDGGRDGRCRGRPGTS